MKGAPLERRAGQTRETDSTQIPSFTVQTFEEVAEAVAAGKMPAQHKINILRAIVRFYSAEPRLTWFAIETGADVDLLALFDPDEYERLLRAYWALLGASRRRIA